jgi:uncharacterized protein (TIGR03435 family)
MLQVSASPAVSIILKATLILGFALIGAGLARRSRASMRHAILAAAFGVLLLLPAASIFAPPLRIPLRVASAREPIEPAPLVMATDIGPIVTPQAGADAGGPRSYELSLSNLLIGVWLAGVGLFSLPVIMGLWQIRSLRRSGLPWLHGQRVAEGLALEVGIRRRIEVLLHESLAGPMTCGVARPAIVFPPEAEEWCQEDLNRAMVHELEHARRGDWILHCLARAVCSVYWFHPLVWVAWRRLTVDAERACDDAVLERSEATAYADQLIGLARRMSARRKLPALAMANRSDLSTRVSAVIDCRQERGRPGAMLVTLACAAAAVVVVAISPLRVVAAPQSDSAHLGKDAQRFEVASVRMEDPKDPHSSLEYTNSPQFRVVQTVFPSNRLTMRHATLRILISQAFGVDTDHIAGPDGLARQSYDLDAKVDGDARLTQEQMRPLLRNLLEERFHLKSHREQKMVPGYALVIAKGGAKLQPNKGAPFIGIQGGYTLRFRNVSVTDFARWYLEKPVKGPVVDRTGIKGMYDFDLKYGPRDPDDPVFARIAQNLYAGLPDIFTVLQEKYGLKLVPEKVAIQTLVIDHVDRAPTEN